MPHQPRSWSRLSVVAGVGAAAVVASLLPMLSTSASTAGGGSGGPGERWQSPVRLHQPLQGQSALRALRARAAVDTTAEANDLSQAGLVDLLRHDSTAWLDTGGRLFYRDRARVASSARAAQLSRAAAATALPYDPSQVFTLHSHPGSQRTLYLDFDGATITGTQWNQSTGRSTLTATPYDTDGNTSSFSTAERNLIQEAWLRVAEDYAPFDLDVTTEEPTAAQIERSSASDQVFGMVAMITSSATIENVVCGGPGVTGVAYVDVFDEVDNTHFQPAWGCTHTYGDLINVSETISHEVGHTFGLSHDGYSSGSTHDEYYAGQGGWTPIMGSGYEPIIQWSDGWYAGATNTENDLKIIANGGAPYRSDEAGGTVATAATLTGSSAIIGKPDDVDVWALGTCSGTVQIDAEPAAYSPDLDIGLTLLDASGSTLATADPTSAKVSSTVASGMDASIARSVADGSYYVAVDGVGRGTKTDGYDDFGSLGSYTLSVTGCDSGPTPTASPTASPTTEPTTDPTPTPPGAPRIDQVARGAAGGKRTIKVWWTPAEDTAEELTGYRIRAYKMVDGRAKKWGTFTVDPSWTGAELNVGKGKWKVAIQGRNSAGYGSYSALSKAVKAR